MPRRSPRVRGRRAARGADTGNEKIGYKVREHSLAKVPVMLVVGRREAEQRRFRCAGSAVRRRKPLRWPKPLLDWKEAAAPPASLADRRRAGGCSTDERRTYIPRPPMNVTPTREGPRINEEIGVMRVRLVDERGEMVGVVARNEALTMAADAGLDLVEIAPNADPPVCKILDFGKFKYEEQKKKNEARKKQKIIEVKEIKLRPSIDDHDYAVKMRSMNKFIEEGDKVKVTMRFRGRELAHQELGMNVLMRVRDDLDGIAKVEQMPRMEGRQMTMVVSPK